MVLKTLAADLNSLVRSSDLVCRIGGDEFVVMLDGADSIQARQFAGRLHRRIGQQSTGDGPRGCRWESPSSMGAVMASAHSYTARRRPCTRPNAPNEAHWAVCPEPEHAVFASPRDGDAPTGTVCPGMAKAH
ncbi:diguanylate cyclase [Mycobacterium sp. MAA66]|uniref:diguanylate cyclase n=1 Tax=Mycobacterium sp. MAA66 TaxID=3156297 RepID=UPI0035173EEF